MFGGARITKGALYLLFASAGLSLIFLLSEQSIRLELFRWFAATGDSIWREFKLWQLITSALLEVDFVSLLFQGFMLWMFMPALERWWGTRRFLLFAGYTSVAGILVGTLVGYSIGSPMPVAGLDSFIFGGIVAYGVLFSNQQVQFFGVLPMTGKQLTIGMCAFVGLFVIIGQQWVEGAAWTSSMLLALILTHDKLSPRLMWLKHKQKKVRRHLRLVKDQEEDPKKWMN